MSGKTKAILAVIIVAAAAFFFLSGSKETPQTTSETPASEAPATQAAAPAAEPAAAPKKDELSVVIVGDLGTFDPHDNVGFPHHQVTRQVYETLVVRDNDQKLVPWLAESWEYEDDETLIFKLRKGIKFHNGDELKASDVIFSFNRMRDDNTTASMQVNRMILDKCEAVDDYTVKVVTDGPYAMQVAMLENPLGCIISERAFKESDGDFMKAPIGTGPYKLVSYQAGDNVRLTKNDGYWREGEPHITNIFFRIITDASSRAIEAESGGTDIVVDISANEVDRVKSAPNVNLVSTSGTNTSYVMFNVSKKPLDDPKVREAIWLASDVKSAIEVAYGDFGKVADGFLSPGIEGRHPDLTPWFPKRDVARAKELLAEAGHPDGITVHISTENSNQQRMDFCEALQAQLAEAGITLVLDFMELNAWVQQLTNGEGELAVYGFTASTGEAGRIMYRFMKDYTSEWRITSWDNPEYYDLTSKALGTIDPEERAKLFYKCQEMLMDARIALPIWHKEINAALRPEVKGFHLMPSYEQHYLQYVYFE